MVNLFNQIQDDNICNDCGLELIWCDVCKSNHHKEFFQSEHDENIKELES